MMVRRKVQRLLQACALSGIALLVPGLLPRAAFAAAAGGLEGWIHTFNFGSGALVLNPIIILIQWVNFLILLIVLNKILYKPLWRLMNERSGRILSDVETAERDRSEAQGYVSQYEDSLHEAQREITEALVVVQQEMTEATRARIEEVRVQSARKLEEVRVDIAAQTEKASAVLEGRARGFAVEISNRLAGRKVA